MDDLAVYTTLVPSLNQMESRKGLTDMDTPVIKYVVEFTKCSRHKYVIPAKSLQELKDRFDKLTEEDVDYDPRTEVDYVYEYQWDALEDVEVINPETRRKVDLNDRYCL